MRKLKDEKKKERRAKIKLILPELTCDYCKRIGTIKFTSRSSVGLVCINCAAGFRART